MFKGEACNECETDNSNRQLNATSCSLRLRGQFWHPKALHRPHIIRKATISKKNYIWKLLQEAGGGTKPSAMSKRDRWVAFLGVPIIRTTIFWGLYWVPLFWVGYIDVISPRCLMLHLGMPLMSHAQAPKPRNLQPKPIDLHVYKKKSGQRTPTAGQQLAEWLKKETSPKPQLPSPYFPWPPIKGLDG